MNGKRWRRRLGKLAFPDPVEASRDAWLEEALPRLAPGEREELADLRDRLNESGLAGLTDAELDRLEALVAILHGGDPGDGRLT
jgi:hypothetical protein